MRRREFLILSSTAIAVPFTVARVQQKAMPVIGYLHLGSANLAPTPAVFLQGLSETGYVPGHNVTIEYRWAEGHYDWLPALAADLVRFSQCAPSARGLPTLASAPLLPDAVAPPSLPIPAFRKAVHLVSSGWDDG